MLHGLPAGHLQLLEDVVVAAGDQDARLADAQILDCVEVFPAGANPGRDLREAQAQRHAALDRLAVALAVDEELGLPDAAVGSAQPAHQLEQLHDLIGRVGIHRLLAVAEGGVGDPDILGHRHGHAAVVEGNLGHLVIVVYVAVQDRVLYVLQRISVVVFLEQIGFRRQFKHNAGSFRLEERIQRVVLLYTIIPLRQRLVHSQFC